MTLATLKKTDKKYLKSKGNDSYQVREMLEKWGFKFIISSPMQNTATKQMVLAISVEKDCKDIETIKNELNAIVPIMIPNKKGFWTIRIFEYTHSEESLYCVGYYPETEEWALAKYVHGDVEINKLTLDVLIELLRTAYYWQEGDDE